jgi:hypothetical protein
LKANVRDPRTSVKRRRNEGIGWDALHVGGDIRRVNHSIAFFDENVCTNQAESYFSRLGRMEIGTHHHIAGPYLNAYAREASWPPCC